jgi:hypothetical protein
MKKNPSLKKEFSYFNDYLRNKLLVNKEKAQTEINNMIEVLVKKNTEESLNDVYLMYMILGESKKMIETIEDVKVKFPKGSNAQLSFINDLEDEMRVDNLITVDYVQQKRKEFFDKFGNEKNIKRMFFMYHLFKQL